MGRRLSDRLKAARHRQFVGRHTERDCFQRILAPPEWPVALVHICGPGGVGKTTLLREVAALCEGAGVKTVVLDGRHFEPTPDAFLAVLRGVLGLPEAAAPLDALAAHHGRSVILVDTYERLRSLDAWLREDFLPELPAKSLVVFAGRRSLSVDWRADPGWQALIETIALRNFSPDEGRAYLSQRGLPEDTYQGILAFTYGHPLALSLVADVYDQESGWRFEPQQAPDVIKILLEHFVQEVPSPAHRTALEACALVHFMTEPLLARMLAIPEVHALFDWLRSLSFIDAGPLGLFPHDLARDALTVDVRWRNPSWYRELHTRARAYYTERLSQTHGLEQQQVLIEYVFLHRDNPVFKPFMSWDEMGTGKADVLQDDDWPALEAMIGRHEGAPSVAWADHWRRRSPDAFRVFRGTDGQPVGLLTLIAWQRDTAPYDSDDPALQAALRYLDQHAPLRAGEEAVFFRFWMCAEHYQAVSPMQSLLFLHISRHYLTTPELAFSFFPCADADFWRPFCAYIDLQHLPEADFEVGGRRFEVYGHDWRAMPPLQWLALLAEREVSDDPAAITAAAVPPLVVLSEEDFSTAVAAALRAYSHPDRMADNPLLRARLVVEAAGGHDTDDVARLTVLRELLDAAAAALKGSEKTARLFDVVRSTYLRPARSQEQAAELLGLPFSTYRRYLKKGVDEINAWLWHREIHGLGTGRTTE